MFEKQILSSSPPEIDFFAPFTDSRSLFRRIQDIAHSLINETFFYGAMASPFLELLRNEWQNETYYPYCYQKETYPQLPWDSASTSTGLTVFLTGLSGIPICWDRYIRLLQEAHFPGHIFVPAIRKGGNCPLQEAAHPIYQTLLDYHHTFPNSPISLVGISNGARIAGYCERQKPLSSAAIQVISIAGAHFGTPLSKIVPEKYLDLLKIDPNLRTELCYDSKKALEHLREWRQAAAEAEGPRKRVFFATTEDEKLLCTPHSLPKIGPTDMHYIIHRHTHISILHGITHQVVPLLHSWQRAHLG